MQKNWLFRLGFFVGLHLGYDRGRRDQEGKDYLTVTLGPQEKRMINLRPGLVDQPINIQIRKADGTLEDRNPTLSNVVMTPNGGPAFSAFTAPGPDGLGGKFSTSNNLGDTAQFTLTGHVKFSDNEEYDVAIKDAQGNVGVPEDVTIADAEAGDSLTVTLGAVQV